METLKNSKFEILKERLEVKHNDGMIALEDDFGNVVELDTTGNERHEVNESMIFDDVEYILSETEKYILLEYAGTFEEHKGAEPFTSDDYSHFENLIHA